jgi:hypothetical protein
LQSVRLMQPLVRRCSRRSPRGVRLPGDFSFRLPHPPLGFGPCKTRPPEFFARGITGRSRHFSLSRSPFPFEVFPLARLCFQRPYGLRSALHTMEKM